MKFLEEAFVQITANVVSAFLIIFLIARSVEWAKERLRPYENQSDTAKALKYLVFRHQWDHLAALILFVFDKDSSGLAGFLRNLKAR